jgi:phosphoesterase RecJ-like protein
MKKQIYQSIDKLKLILEGSSKKIRIVTHRNPDGDAIGSSLAMNLLLNKLGHEVKVITPNIFPDFLKWMTGSSDILIFDLMAKAVRQAIYEADIIICLDFSELSRVKEFQEEIRKSKAYKVLVDHHPDPELFSDVTYSDIDASSTAELVFRLIKDIGLVSYVDKEIASCIFTGIMTDTGCFSFNSSKERTYEYVKELLHYNIDKDNIYYQVYDNFSVDRMRLLGYCLNEKMEVFPEYKTAFISITGEELKKYNFRAGDTEGFVNYPLSVRGILFSALFTEKKDIVKISFRSKGNFAANKIAKKYFNGGGHLNAAGGESYTSLTDTIKLFKSLLPEYKDEIFNDSD